MVYVLSDIHGNERRFDSIMEQINLREEDSLYILGDVVDRHPGGIRILRRIMNMPNAHMLLGNHEHMMLCALGCPYDPDDKMLERDILRAERLWHHNGGNVTHQYWKRIRKDVRADVIEFLRGLPLNINIEVNRQHYKLVHGAPVEDYDEWSEFDDATQVTVWKRLYREDIAFCNAMMKAIPDQRKFIRDIKTLIKHDAYADYFKEQKKLCAEIVKKYGQVNVRTKEDTDQFAAENPETAEALQMALERAMLRVRSMQLRSKPSENVEKSINLLMDIDPRLFSKLDEEEKETLKTELDELKKIVAKFLRQLSK